MRELPTSLKEFEHIVKLHLGQTKVYSRGFNYEVMPETKSAAHPYTMSTIDTLSATRRNTTHMRLSFKFSLVPEGAGDLLNFIRFEMGATSALRISRFIIAIYHNGWKQRCCTRHVEYSHP